MDLKTYAKEHNVPIIEDEGLDFILNLMKENNVKNILEIGTAIGYSAIQFAAVSPEVMIDTVERNETMYEVAIDAVEQSEYAEQINIHYMDAIDFQPNHTYDLIFIDAAKAQYRKFFEKFSSNLSKNGVIVCDNLKFHGLIERRHEVESRDLRQLLRKINDFVEFLKTNDHYDTTFYDVGDGISVSKRR